MNNKIKYVEVSDKQYAGDIYQQTGGSGSDFIASNQGSRIWSDMAAAPNGDVYVAFENGDIYKQTGGAGKFVASNQAVEG